MKRLHIHIGVEKLEDAIHFYTTLFGAEPVKTKPDYAKWSLEDPFMNFAISTRAFQKGIDHLGIQVDEEHELKALRGRLSKSGIAVFDEGETVCCYARSEKTWLQDPACLPWEVYRTMDDAEMFSSQIQNPDEACCTPETMGKPDCCEPTTITKSCCA